MAHPFGAQAAVDVDGYDAGGQFSLDGPHGAATWSAIVAFVLVMFIVGRGRGLLGAIASGLVFVGLVGAAQVAFGHLAHSYTNTHPESPLAVGLEFNMSGA